MFLKQFNVNSNQYKTKNFKGVISLLAGNSISKIILILGGVLLAKLYGPENYGVYSVFLSYIMILPALSNLELNNIAIMQMDGRNVRNIFSAALLAGWVIVVGIVCIIYLLKQFNIIHFALSDLLLFLCGVGGIFTGWNFSQHALFTKYKLFKQVSVSLIIASIFSVVFQGFFYLIGWHENGLIYGWLMGLAASFLYNFRVAKGRWNKIDFPLLKISLKKNINIVKYAYTSTAINILANNILPILVLIYFTKLEVGVYAMAIKILATPFEMISKSVSNIYFQRAVNLFRHNSKQLLHLTKKLSLISSLLIFVYLILMNTIGIYLLEFIFTGNEWIGLRKFTLILSVWILARSFMGPVADVMVVINRNQYSLIFNIYLFLINLIAIYLGVQYQSFEVCLCIFAIFSALGYFIQWIAVINDLKKMAK